ncbi:hypothetical protein AB6A40_011306 [Gnathostoma spinigerum]|uniref:Uncharacterized protein n=1 Tax=Gnathostoma spinigerum TaxID=75299 RepID=A0ABD6EZL2_9BILA
MQKSRQQTNPEDITKKPQIGGFEAQHDSKYEEIPSSVSRPFNPLQYRPTNIRRKDQPISHENYSQSPRSIISERLL